MVNLIQSDTPKKGKFVQTRKNSLIEVMEKYK